MGTRIPKVMLLLVVVSFALSAVAWADTAPVPPAKCTNADDSEAAVYFYDDTTFEALITVGSSNGLRPCAQVAFYRNGVEMARGTVVQVRASDAVVATAESGPQGPIVQRGDIVRVVQNGTRADVRAAVLKEQAWRTLLDYGMTGLLAVLIVIGR